MSETKLYKVVVLKRDGNPAVILNNVSHTLTEDSVYVAFTKEGARHRFPLGIVSDISETPNK